MAEQLVGAVLTEEPKRYPKIEAAIAQLAVHESRYHRKQTISFGVLTFLCVSFAAAMILFSRRFPYLFPDVLVFVFITGLILAPRMVLDKDGVRYLSTSNRQIGRSPAFPGQDVTELYARTANYLMSARARALTYEISPEAAEWPIIKDELSQICSRLESAAERLEGIDGQAATHLGRAFIVESFDSAWELNKRLDYMDSAVSDYHSALAFDDGSARTAALDLAIRQIRGRI